MFLRTSNSIGYLRSQSGDECFYQLRTQIIALDPRKSQSGDECFYQLRTQISLAFVDLEKSNLSRTRRFSIRRRIF